jgi:hypothetical protein
MKIFSFPIPVFILLAKMSYSGGSITILAFRGRWSEAIRAKELW